MLASDNAYPYLPRFRVLRRRNLHRSLILFRYLSRRSIPVVFAGWLVCTALWNSPMACAQSAAPSKLRILFPAYANPYNEDGRAMWAKLVELSRQRPAGLEIDVVFNPASGPGKDRDPNYLTADGTGPLADAQGLRMLGYVSTNYGKRPAAELKREIDIYATGFYAGYVSGVFFDEMSSDLGTAEYYRDLNQYAHEVITPRAGNAVITISNPGIGEVQAPVTEDRLRDYATAMDKIVVFEQEAKLYRDVKPAAVAAFLSPDRLVHIVHSQATWSPELVAAMQRRGVTNIYITDDLMPNPYHKLPSYFDKLCAAVATVNRSQ
jgi:Spherulation-specific family 4